jgi:hypothetical protein
MILEEDHLVMVGMVSDGNVEQLAVTVLRFDDSPLNEVACMEMLQHFRGVPLLAGRGG